MLNMQVSFAKHVSFFIAGLRHDAVDSLKLQSINFSMTFVYE